MLSVVIAIHLMLVLALIGVVLLQKSEGGGLVSSTSGFLSNRGTANVLTRATALLAAGFFVTSLVLSLLASHERAPSSIIGTPSGQQAPAPGAPAPLTPLSPLNLGGNAPGGSGPGTAGGGSSAPAAPAAPTAPTAPAPPSGPQVPQSR